MNSKRKKITTILISLVCILALTLVTHYIVTQIPTELKNYNDSDAATHLSDVNSFDAFTGVTPLMRAAIDSDFVRAKLLLEQGAQVNIRSANADQDYAINYALINGGQLGSLAVAQLLLANGANVNVANARGLAPIHAMMQITNFDNRAQILKDLMARGANINTQAEDGSTMLHITVTMNDIDWINHLNKEYGQIINYELKDKKGRTPLDLAIQLGHVSVNDADSVENALRKRPAYLGDDYDIKATDSFGRNGLQLAVIRQDMKFIRNLIEHGTNLSHQDTQGNTALHYAVKSPASSKRNEIVQLLINAGSPLTIANKQGKTVLEYVQEIGDTQLLQMLDKAKKQNK